MKYLSILLILVFITGCSNKKYFEPKEYNEEEKFDIKTINSSIESMNRVGATLVNKKFINKNGIEKLELEENFKFINLQDNKLIASNYKDKLYIDKKIIETVNPVIAASIKGNKLAIIYSNNTVELQELDTQKTLFKEYLPLSLANDTRTVNPLFLEKIVLFPTLDGKLLIVSLDTNKVVRDIIVDAKGQFNNPIFLNVVDNTLITATANKILAINNQTLFTKEYELRDIILKDKFIYIATIDGQIIKLDLQLNELAKTKYKYAKFHTLASKANNIYALESQGFLIKISDDLIKDTIYEFDFDNEKRVLFLNDKIYFDENYLELP